MSDNDALLTKLREFVHRQISGFSDRDDLQWAWASDGGIFGFPSSEFRRNTTEKAVDCAIAIWQNLPNDVGQKIELHISLDRGDAFFVKEKGMRRSDALNTAAKLKSPTGQTAILVTQRICDDLAPQRAEEFHEEEPLPDGTKIYAYLPALQRGMADLAYDHENKQEWMIAAHCHYRRGRYLMASGKFSDAAIAFRAAVTATGKVPEEQRHRYFHCTLDKLYVAWCSLAGSGVKCSYPAQRDFFATEAVAKIFSSNDGSMKVNLVTHFEMISEQLDLLCAKLLSTAVGLSTLETALLLQRVGYSPHYFGGALANRIERIQQDMAKNHHRSIDGDCSMCSGTALSALSLGGNDFRKDAEEIHEWLRRLGPDRYCVLGKDYTDAPPNAHALQYAAKVLQGFLDAGGESTPRSAEAEKEITDVVDVFFTSVETDGRQFFKSWMLHRNIDAFEVCTYVFPAFLRYLISKRELKPRQEKRLKHALNVLAKNLLADASDSTKPGRLYAARENVGSLALGLLLGMGADAEKVAKHAFGLFANRAKSDYIERGATTLDSNLDRTQRFLDGWLLQWEAMLTPYKRKKPMPAYVRDVLGPYTPEPIE